MRKRFIVFLGIILATAAFIFFWPNDNEIELPPTVSPSNGSTPNEDDISAEEPRYIYQLRMAYEGRMDRTHAIIGENAEQYLYEESTVSSFLGGLSINNSKEVLLTNGYIDDNGNPVYGDVVVIIKDEAYDIKSEMTMEKVKDAFGEPDEIIDFNLEDESELYERNTIFSYEVGDYEVVIIFDPLDKTVIAIHLNGFKNNLGYPTAKSNKIDLLNLSTEELDVYNRYKSNYDEEELRGLEPLSVMKLYIHAGVEKDLETEWELYTNEENRFLWGKEYHISEFDGGVQINSSIFENAVNIRVNYIDDDDVSISWEDKYLESYDSRGYYFRFSFGLVKSKDGIWKVTFLPMQ